MRLMLLAYRRGLLLPYYEYGIQSRVREDLILQILEKELEMEGYKLIHEVNVAVAAPNLSKDSFSRFNLYNKNEIEQILDRMEYGNRLFVSAEEQLIKESDSIIKLFKELKESGRI